MLLRLAQLRVGVMSSGQGARRCVVIGLRLVMAVGVLSPPIPTCRGDETTRGPPGPNGRAAAEDSGRRR
jgi:hypothetical protein